MRVALLVFLGLLASVSSALPQEEVVEAGLEEIRAFHRISERLATAGQVTYEQIPEIEAAGFDVVVNLALADEKRNGSEGFLVVKEGMTYVHIPVSSRALSLRDLEMFFAIMESNEDRNVLVHCAANVRASVFVYLYRTLKLDVPTNDALVDLNAVFDPTKSERWMKFMADAEKKFK